MILDPRIEHLLHTCASFFGLTFSPQKGGVLSEAAMERCKTFVADRNQASAIFCFLDPSNATYKNNPGLLNYVDSFFLSFFFFFFFFLFFCD